MEKILLTGGSGLVGQALNEALRNDYLVVQTAGHNTPKNGYRLAAEDTGLLKKILERENPDIVISSIRGNFGAQMNFHSKLADWLADKDKRLLYISTANVFDGDLSRPRTEADPPSPESDYGIFKRDCEEMLTKRLGKRLIIFRPASVWDSDCPRILKLKEDSLSGAPHPTYSGDSVNITYTKQIGAYAKYVLQHGLSGIFHVGTKDLTDYYDFEKAVCGAVGIKPPNFAVTKAEAQAYQAVIPDRKEIPDELQMTVSQVLKKLSGNTAPSEREPI